MSMHAKDLLLAGLTDHEAAAIEIMAGMHWREQRAITLPRSLNLGVPEQTAPARACGACVVDLFGLGMRRHTPEHETRLLAFLSGRSAVLLVWGGGGGWLEQPLALASGQQLAWVTMPYTSAVMLDALKRLHASAAAVSPPPRPPIPAPVKHTPASASTPAPSPAAEAPVPAWRRAMALADRLKAAAPPPNIPERALEKTPDKAVKAVETVEKVAAKLTEKARKAPEKAPGPAPAAPALATPAVAVPPLAPPVVRLVDSGEVGVGEGGLKAVLAAFAPLAEQPLIRLVGQLVSHPGAQLLRVGGEAAFVVHARQGWMACGLPVPTLLKTLRTPAVLQSVSVAPLPADEVEETVRQRFGGRFQRAQKPLDVIAWELAGDALRHAPLTPAADLVLQLRGFPNFTVLADVGPMDVQLAAICARGPQSVADLARAFPGHEQDVYRFAVLCILSGLAVLTRQPATAAARPAAVPSAAAAAAAAPQVAARRGFFKSLLDKLF
ncbi:MAG: hypothetical protein Q4G71_14990 [Pseudomonadota bacterium]|nr:hypothetical protein [Pseudomonadota bacterium]